MIDVKKAIEIAFASLADLFGREEASEIRLEEVEKSEDDRHWLITVSFLRVELASDSAAAFAEAMGAPPVLKRSYKTVKIGAHDGEVVSIKIRQLTPL